MKREKIKRFIIPIIRTLQNKRIENKNFTIISNNCFGGVVYLKNAIEYQSPTCGLYFMADEYIKFIYNLDYYLSIDDIKEIKLEDSKYVDYLKKIKSTSLIGKIGDVEVMFLHYKNIDEAKSNWNRRKKRINKDRIIYKFNDQNLCNYSHLKKFDEFPAKNKICFTSKKYDDIDTIQLKQFEKYEYVLSDTEESDYKKYFNIYRYINKI